MNWMMSNVTVKPDKNDNIFPNKSTPEAKIDGPAALFTAMSRMLVNGGEPEASLSDHPKVTASVHFKEALMILMILAPLIGVIGAALFSYGAWLVFPPAGFITAGVLCLFWSWAVSKYLSAPRNVQNEGGD